MQRAVAERAVAKSASAVMSTKSQARAVQKVSGARYQAALTEVRKRRDDISALKDTHPEMAFTDCAVAVCFESLDDLQSRWGDIFWDEFEYRHPELTKPWVLKARDLKHAESRFSESWMRHAVAGNLDGVQRGYYDGGVRERVSE